MLLRLSRCLSGAARRLSMAKSDNFTFANRNGVALLTLDMPGKVNVLNESLQNDFAVAIDRIYNDPGITSAVFISGKPHCFIAGADIKMLETAATAEELSDMARKGQSLYALLEDCPKPIVAAIMGDCLGGGAELALACHYRIAVNNKKTKIGWPEVMLGLLPGAGGTQRVPRILPPLELPTALSLLLTGAPARPDKAKKLGLVHMLVDPLGPGVGEEQALTRDYLESIALDVAAQLASKKMKVPARRNSNMDMIFSTLFKIDYLKNYIFDQARQGVMKKTYGLYPAPLRIIQVVKSGLENPETGYEEEAKGFGELGMTPESRALIGLFHGQTACKKNRFGAPARKVETVAVLGAGLMGAGVAQVSLVNAGLNTIMKDVQGQALQRGYNQIHKNLTTEAKKRKLTEFERDAHLARLQCSVNYADLSNADIVIEAVFEDIKVKHAVIKEAEAVIPAHCVFASNTSALPISDIAAASKRPEKVIGMHYFSPVDKMQLLEIITTDKTSKDTTATAVDLGLKQGKVVITVKDAPGFYTTRILSFALSEIMRILQEGVSFEELDRITKRGGFPVGSAKLIDEVGIDVAAHIAEYLGGVFGARIAGGDMSVLQKMTEAGFTGRKSEKGLYLYGKQAQGKLMNEEAVAIFKEHSIEPKLENTPELIFQRVLLRFVNEAVLTLQEGVLANPTEGDIGAVFGLGFPPVTGGPFRYVDQKSAATVCSEMDHLAQVYGPEFAPCQLLRDMARDGKKFFN